MEYAIEHHRENEPFEEIKRGNKTYELRLFDEKREKIRIGDVIRVVNRENGEVLYVRVIGLSRFSSFDKLNLVLGIKDYERKILREVYSREREEKYGVLAIHFELLR